MSCFTKSFDGLADAIITEALIADSLEIIDGEPLPKYHFTKTACWDTGAQFTVISQRVVEKLGLTPTGLGNIMGVGGDSVSNSYTVHIALPNGDLVSNVTVYSGDIDDYDVLIGMDIIQLLDITVTNNPNTIFSFRYPSEGSI